MKKVVKYPILDTSDLIAVKMVNDQRFDFYLQIVIRISTKMKLQQ